MANRKLSPDITSCGDEEMQGSLRLCFQRMNPALERVVAGMQDTEGAANGPEGQQQKVVTDGTRAVEGAGREAVLAWPESGWVEAEKCWGLTLDRASVFQNHVPSGTYVLFEGSFLWI